MMALARTFALCGAALLPLLAVSSVSAQQVPPDFNRHSDANDPGPYNDYWFGDGYAEDASFYDDDWYTWSDEDAATFGDLKFAYEGWYANPRPMPRPPRAALPVGPSRDWYSDQFGYPPRQYVEYRDTPAADDPWLYDDFTYDEPYKHGIGYYDDGFYDDDWFFDYYDFGYDYGW